MEYLIVIASLVVLDAFWLAFVMDSFYKKRLGHIMPEKVNVASTIPFYLIYALAIVVFIVWPHESQNFTVGTTFLRGILLGFAAYAAYDFTNQATVRGWSWSLTGVDLLWGGFMTGAVSVIAVLL